MNRLCFLLMALLPMYAIAQVDTTTVKERKLHEVVINANNIAQSKGNFNRKM